MNVSLRRLAAAGTSLTMLGLAPALMTASDAAQPTPAAAHRAYVGNVGGTGNFRLRLTNLPDGTIKATWKTSVVSRSIDTWKLKVSTSRKVDQHVRSYTVGRTARSAIIKHADLVTPASGDYTFVQLYLFPKNSKRNRHPRPYASPTWWIKAPVTTVPAPAVRARATVATFNVRTWNGESGMATVNKWPSRRPHVVGEIQRSGAGVIAIQEASGGKSGGYGDVHQRQVIVDDLNATRGDPWALTSFDSYYHSDSDKTVDGLQGTRILYDTSRYTLLEQGYLDVGKPAGTAATVWIPWARFEQRSTGARFSFLSVHLTQEADPAAGPFTMSNLRVLETRRIADEVDALNAAHPGEQAIVAGDMNSTIYTYPDNSVHREYVRRGFYDAFATTDITNGQYPTTNSFKFPVAASPHRRDYILTKGGPTGSFRYVNEVYQDRSQTASDHYLQVAELPLE